MSVLYRHLLFSASLLALWALSGVALAEEAKLLRVGGDYLVTAVEHSGEREFHVEFKAVTPSGKFDVLNLHSDHVHIAVKKGEKLRLSAEILNSKGAVAEVAQMVIFLPSNLGPTPVWLLSNRASNHELRAVKYLEMHSPQTDYVIM